MERLTKSMCKAILLSIGLMTLVAVHSRADTIALGGTVSVSAGGCSNSGSTSTNNGLTSMGCDSITTSSNATANASTGGGSTAVGVVATESFPESGPLLSLPGASADAMITDAITPPDNGFLRITPNFTGAFTLSCSGTINGAAECGYDFFIHENFTLEGFPTEMFVSGGVAPIAVEISQTDPVNGMTAIPSPSPDFWIIPVVGGQEYTFSYYLSASVAIDCSNLVGFNCPLGGTASIVGDFVDPPTLTQLDANMNPIADATITSALGINYSGTVATPEPTALGLILPAAALLAVVLRRSRKDRCSLTA